MTISPLTERLFNFSAGPAALPVSVLEQVRDDLLLLPGAGVSVLEISHRSPAFLEILEATKSCLRSLLDIPENYQLFFLQGGSRLQFSMAPMNLYRSADASADYVLTGAWGNKALEQARKVGKTHVVWDAAETSYDRIPSEEALEFSADAEYVHITSNETIHGVQLPATPPNTEAPVVCDCSSDILSRPIPIDQYGLIYACSQKNAGPAGVTMVIIRDDLLERSDANLPGYLNYREHAEANSLYNTPPTFAIYVMGLVARWLQDEVGGLANMEARNREKAALVYDVLDESHDFFRGHAQPNCRSLMNATFRLPTAECEAEFLKSAAAQGLTDLKGHRSVGGIRASIYNAMPREGVAALCSFMRDFRDRHAS